MQLLNALSLLKTSLKQSYNPPASEKACGEEKSVKPASAPAPPAESENLRTSLNFWTSFIPVLDASWTRFCGLLDDYSKGDEKLNSEEEQVAKAYHLLPTKDNVRRFLRAAKGYEEGQALGPGNANDAVVKDLQRDLGEIGFPIEVNGEYDERTMQAVRAFKHSECLHEGYQVEDGNWAVNEYATPETIQVIKRQLDDRHQVRRLP
ncbi:MAG TPA: peptidoglycan-binding domain-containing protein [Chroococcales cyanobacterium]